jgi:hypothetical protein
MKIIADISTVVIFILCLIFNSTVFYSHDFNLTTIEVVLSIILSFPMTVYVEWLRDRFSFTDDRDK